jgi:hypothetical protein
VECSSSFGKNRCKTKASADRLLRPKTHQCPTQSCLGFLAIVASKGAPGAAAASLIRLLYDSTRVFQLSSLMLNLPLSLGLSQPEFVNAFETDALRI